jgi:HAD superfamily hydrolase (TIGR01509 family)
VIFDCDGVLIDSELISARVLIAHLACVGVIVDMAYVRAHFLGRSFPKVAARVREDCGFALPDDFESAYRATLLTAFEAGLKPMPGIAAVLADLRVACCVATSSSPVRARRSLELTGLLAHFDGRIFTASEVANGKPAPDLFLHAARQMGVQPENCLVIEDSAPGIAAALAAKMRILHFTGGSHLKNSAPLPQEAAHGEAHKIETFDNWAEFFNIVPELRQRARPEGAAL